MVYWLVHGWFSWLANNKQFTNNIIVVRYNYDPTNIIIGSNNRVEPIIVVINHCWYYKPLATTIN